MKKIKQFLMHVGIFYALSFSSLSWSKNIIFALDELLFTLDAKKVTKELDISYATWFWLWWYRHDLIQPIMQSLDQLQAPTVTTAEHQAFYQGHKLSPLVCAWLMGHKKNHEIGPVIIRHLHSSNLGQWHWIKKPLMRMSSILFDTPKLVSMIMAVPEGVNLVSRCHKTHRHTLFILSNCPAEILHGLQTKFPEIFSLFHGIITSANTGKLKPHKPIYDHLLATYQLSPYDCVYIGTARDGLEMAQNLGMQTIEWDPYNHIAGIKKMHAMALLD